MNKNYEFFMKANVDNYLGEWIAICNQKIVSHGKDVRKVFYAAKKKCPSINPFLARVPDGNTVILKWS